MAKVKALSALLEVTGAKSQQEGETADAFMERIHKSADKLEDADWKKLPEAVQTWSNDFSTALDKGGDKPRLSGVLDVGEAKTNGAAAPKAAKGKTKKKRAAAEEPAPKAAKGKKAKAAKEPKKGKKAKGALGRPRIVDDAKLKRKVKTLPEGNRNEYWDKIPAGTPMAKIRKNKSHLRVVRYWRRNGYVDLVA